MLISGQVRIIKGWLCPTGLAKGLRKCTAGARNGKKIPLRLIFFLILVQAFN